jgi:hypothetical protein
VSSGACSSREEFAQNQQCRCACGGVCALCVSFVVVVGVPCVFVLLVRVVCVCAAVCYLLCAVCCVVGLCVVYVRRPLCVVCYVLVVVRCV